MFDAFFTIRDGGQSGCLYLYKLFPKWVALSSILLVVLVIHFAKQKQWLNNSTQGSN